MITAMAIANTLKSHPPRPELEELLPDPQT
jgi:hypothetical protein